jgi:general secretion pathway protein D
VTDNKEARIQVGEQVPIVTTETIASTTTNAQRTIQYKDIGIILKVKPRINEADLSLSTLPRKSLPTTLSPFSTARPTSL